MTSSERHKEINHVMCTINDAYAQHCAVLLASLFENNKDLSFHIHVFSFSISEDSRKRLESLVRSYGQSISVGIIQMPDIQLPNLGGALCEHRYLHAPLCAGTLG